MFSECRSLTNINLSNFNTQTVTNMSSKFSLCRCLTKINLFNFNTQNVTNMSYMFYECNALTNINFLISILKMLLRCFSCSWNVMH